jgi:hypothetical protein
MLRKIPRTGESRSRRRPPCRRCEYKSVEGEGHMMDCVAVPPPSERAEVLAANRSESRQLTEGEPGRRRWQRNQTRQGSDKASPAPFLPSLMTSQLEHKTAR